MNFEIYAETLSAINQKKLLKLDSETSIIFQKKLGNEFYNNYLSACDFSYWQKNGFCDISSSNSCMCFFLEEN